MRIGILSSHPIQYNSCWFRGLASQSGVDLEVLYCHRASPKEQAAAGFGVEFDWDRSLLDGYGYRFLKNVSTNPSVITFGGLDTPEIREVIGKEKFDALIINGWHYKSAWQAMRSCWRTGTPIMMRSDSHLRTERSLFKRTTKWPFYSWFIPKLDACLPVGKWSSDYFVHYGAHNDRIFIVPHVVDTDFFFQQWRGLQTQRNALRDHWKLGSDTVVFIFVGKFIEKKRPLDFVAAIARAAKGNAAIQGFMVGDGPLRRACEDEVAGKSLPILFSGFLNQSQIPSAYCAADALVLPSDAGETWGLVVNEAMACGKPCFITDQVGCGPDMVIGGQTGDLYPMGDIAALSELLCGFASDPERRNAMSSAAQAKAEACTVSVAVERVLEAVDTVRHN